MQPPGGHAIYLDARASCPTFQLHNSRAGTRRGTFSGRWYPFREIGSLMFGEHAILDLVRLAIPRRVYTQSHIDYVVEVILDVW